MYELGVVLAQMVFGLDVVRKYNSPSEVIRSSAPSPDLPLRTRSQS